MKHGIVYMLFGMILGINEVKCQSILGARSVALGQAVTALPQSAWALFANPALMDSVNTSISFFGIRYYGFSEITDMAASFNYPGTMGVIGIGAHRYGFDLFNESRIRLAYKGESGDFYYGAALNYNHVSQGGGYGSSGAVGLDVGIAAVVFKRLWFGARATNINQPEYAQIDEALPRELSVGFSYPLSDIALFTSDIVKDVRFPVSFRGGIEVFILKGFSGRAGITTEPTTFSLGFGYNSRFWRINVAAQNHQDLGISPGVDLGITW